MKQHCNNCGFTIIAGPERIEKLGSLPVLNFLCDGCPLSHVATIDVEIKDLGALKAAAARLGLELVEGQTTYRWWGHHVGDYPVPDGFKIEDLGKCEHAIRVPPGKVVDGFTAKHQFYEIGVTKRRDGRPGYTLLWDFIGGGMGLDTFVGKDCIEIKQAYATEAAKRAAISRGFRVTEQQLADGKIRLVCNR